MILWDPAHYDEMRSEYSAGVTLGWHAALKDWFLLDVVRIRADNVTLKDRVLAERKGGRHGECEHRHPHGHQDGGFISLSTWRAPRPSPLASWHPGAARAMSSGAGVI